MGLTTSNEISVKREDLTYPLYAGMSMSKTNKFLTTNLGKIIKITDKLITNSNDIQGMESMNEIRLFINKHPNQIICYMDNVIIKGYDYVWDNLGEHIKMFTRSDFVDEYSGWTKFKTNLLLTNNLNNTLLIVGKFIINKNDYYGIEAMNEIKDFLRKHPDEIIIKINGIKIETPAKEDNNHNIIKIRRHNLLDKYTGYSYDKTTNFLFNNLNKTIIIMDDLIISPYDNFGIEIDKSIRDFLILHDDRIKIKYYNKPCFCM